MTHKIDVTVSSSATSVYLESEGTVIELESTDGKTWTAVRELDIDDTLDIVFKVRGLNGTAWSISVTIDDGYRPILKESGTITENNYSLLKKSIPLKQKQS